jgi:hypothetical protein
MERTTGNYYEAEAAVKGSSPVPRGSFLALHLTREAHPAVVVP